MKKIKQILIVAVIFTAIIGFNNYHWGLKFQWASATSKDTVNVASFGKLKLIK